MSFEENLQINPMEETTQLGSFEEEPVEVNLSTSKTLDLNIDLETVEELTKEEKIEIAYEQTKRDEAITKLGEYDDITQQYELTEQGERGRNSGFVVNQAGNVYKRILRELKRLDEAVLDTDMQAEPGLIKLLARIFDSNDRDEMIKLAAFIATSNVIQGTQIGLASTPPERTIVRRIGQQITFEAFISCLSEAHPRLVSLLSKYQLNDPVTGVGKKIKIAYKRVNEIIPDTFEWEPFHDSDILKIGNFLANCVYDGCYVESATQCLPNGKPCKLPVFETIHVPTGKATREKAIVLTSEGMALLDDLSEYTMQHAYANPPMLFPPRDWSYKGVGGYYITQPAPISQLIHNSSGSVPSLNAIAALNKLQSIPWKINSYIFNILCELDKENITVGSFRSYEPEAFRILTDPNIDPEDERLPWQGELTPEEVLRRNRAYAIRKQWQAEEEQAKNNAVTPTRVLAAAATILEDLEDYGLDQFYVPWFMDNRTRMYPCVDTLSPQGTDYQKALMIYANGVKKSNASHQELLVSIATTFGGGIDKLSFEGRADWAQKFLGKISADLHPVVQMVEDPLSEVHRPMWMQADEPFQFLSLCKEYVDVFIKGIQDTHHVSAGRDATCSGIQITGALLRDQRTCELVNVLPAADDKPQDAYAAVAEEARKLIANDDWLLKQVTKREKNRELQAQRALKAYEKEEVKIPELKPKPYVPRSFEETKAGIPLDAIDRSVAKMVVMLTPYGGQFPTMLDHVRDKLKKKEIKLAHPDYTIVTHALIEGMGIALRAFGEVNAWFKTLAKATIQSKRDSSDVYIAWQTPNGSIIQQEYYPVDTNMVRTFTKESGVVRTYSSAASNYDRLNRRKMQTALAANVVHSLDATIIQDAVCDYNGTAFTAVHDCIYGPSGTLDALTKKIKAAFYNTCVANNPLQMMLELNLPNEEDRSELPVLMYGDAKISKAALSRSRYLFS